MIYVYNNRKLAGRIGEHITYHLHDNDVNAELVEAIAAYTERAILMYEDNTFVSASREWVWANVVEDITSAEAQGILEEAMGSIRIDQAIRQAIRNVAASHGYTPVEE